MERHASMQAQTRVRGVCAETAVSRPPVDIVIPFAGSAAELEALVARLAQVELGSGDTVLVADNRPAGPPPVAAGHFVHVVPVREARSSYHARNRGAAFGDAAWLLFLDADVEWSAELLDAYFEPAPAPDTAVLAGGIEDAPILPGARSTLAERYAVAKRTMAAHNTLESSLRPPYAQTANALVRRAAFDAVSGFADQIRSGGDADLCFRLQTAGWKLERRPAARVIHRNRRAVGALLGQKLKHGAGAAWLERRYPGSFPRRSPPGLACWSVRELLAALRSQDRAASDGAITLLDVAAVWAFELGRLGPNGARRPRGR